MDHFCCGGEGQVQLELLLLSYLLDHNSLQLLLLLQVHPSWWFFSAAASFCCYQQPLFTYREKKSNLWMFSKLTQNIIKKNPFSQILHSMQGKKKRRETSNKKNSPRWKEKKYTFVLMFSATFFHSCETAVGRKLWTWGGEIVIKINPQMINELTALYAIFLLAQMDSINPSFFAQ